LFTARRVQLATLAARHMVPMTNYRQVGVYTGSNPQGREASRTAGVAIDQIRVRHQRANGEIARHRSANALQLLADKVIE
jgi:hypothetical protein